MCRHLQTLGLLVVLSGSVGMCRDSTGFVPPPPGPEVHRGGPNKCGGDKFGKLGLASLPAGQTAEASLSAQTQQRQWGKGQGSWPATRSYSVLPWEHLSGGYAQAHKDRNISRPSLKSPRKHISQRSLTLATTSKKNQQTQGQVPWRARAGRWSPPGLWAKGGQQPGLQRTRRQRIE